MLSSMRHPDLVMFLGACLEPGRPIMCVTEYMPGWDVVKETPIRPFRGMISRVISTVIIG